MSDKYFKRIMIEPTNICNLRCPVCPTGLHYDGKPRGAMTFRQFKNLFDSVTGYLEHIMLYNFGEPFLAPDIMKIINYIRQHNIFIVIHTNGTVLSKAMMNQFKKHNSKTLIVFSIDGITPKSYSYYRRGGKLYKVLDNLSYLINLKEKYGLFNITICWQFLVMKANEHEIPKVINVAEKMKVDILRLKTISIDKNRDPRYNDFIPNNKKYHRKIKPNFVKKNLDSCEFIKPGRPVISWNGDVLPCCLNLPNKYIMGNAFKGNILDIWDSNKYRKFRDNYKNDINAPCNTICSNRNKYKTYIKKIDFKKNNE